MNIIQEATYEIILHLSKYFQNRCQVCHKRCTTGKYFAIHHKKYKDNEKIYSDFRDSKGKIDRLSYYRYLKHIIEKLDPKTRRIRFALTCNKCHYSVEWLKRYKPENRKRLVRLVNESVP